MKVNCLLLFCLIVLSCEGKKSKPKKLQVEVASKELKTELKKKEESFIKLKNALYHQQHFFEIEGL